MSVQPGLMYMALRQLQRFRINVGPGYPGSTVQAAGFFAFLPDRGKFHTVAETELLHCEIPGNSRTAVRGNQSRFRQDRTGAAARIIQRHSGLPRAQADQRGGQGFPQGSLAVPGTVSAAGKRFTGRIQQNPHQVGMDGNQHRESSAVFRENAETGFGLQPFQDCLFGNRLTVPRTHQPAPCAFGGYIERFGAGYVLLP